MPQFNVCWMYECVMNTSCPCLPPSQHLSSPKPEQCQIKLPIPIYDLYILSNVSLSTMVSKYNSSIFLFFAANYILLQGTI